MKTSTVRIRRLLAIGTAGAIAAALVNALIYGAGRAADLAFVVDSANTTSGEIRLVHVVSFSLQTFAVGLVAALVASRLRRPSLRSLQILGAVVAVASTAMDLPIDASPAAKATLAVMHLVVGAAYVASLQLARRPIPQRSSSVTRVARADLEPVAA